MTIGGSLALIVIGAFLRFGGLGQPAHPGSAGHRRDCDGRRGGRPDRVGRVAGQPPPGDPLTPGERLTPGRFTRGGWRAPVLRLVDWAGNDQHRKQPPTEMSSDV